MHQINAMAQLLSTRTYMCECGYIYQVGECGRMWEEKVRDECQSNIVDLGSALVYAEPLERRLLVARWIWSIGRGT